MPANENTLEAMCETCGVRRDDFALLQRKGITDSAAAKARDYGISAKDLRDLYYQFGDTFAPIFLTVIDMVKAPKLPVAVPAKKPVPRPVEEENNEG